MFSYLKHLESGHELEISRYPKNKFCNMVVSNPNCKTRNDFFKILNKLKRVDSGGRFMNNMGGPIEDKLKFIAEYRFTIAFEMHPIQDIRPKNLLNRCWQVVFLYTGEIRKLTLSLIQKVSSMFMNTHHCVKLPDHILEIEVNNDLYDKIKLKPWLINDRPTANQDYNLISNRLQIVINDLINQQPIAEKTSGLFKKKKKFKTIDLIRLQKKPIWQI